MHATVTLLGVAKGKWAVLVSDEAGMSSNKTGRSVESLSLLDGEKRDSSSARRQKRAERTTEFYEQKAARNVPPGLQRNQKNDRPTKRHPRHSNEATQPSQQRFRPYFIVAVTLVEVAVFIYELAAGGIAPISFTPKREELGSVPVFGQNYNESVQRSVISNWFIGPDPTFLVHNAAKFTLCMRKDTELLTRLARVHVEENYLRCCSLNDGSKTCGMVLQEDCESFPTPGTVLGGASQCDDSSGLCGGGVTLRPCCVGLDAGCLLTSRENCSFQNGYWHANSSLCRDVSCLGDVCKVTAFGDTPDSQENANQWYRFITPIFLHAGVIHIVLVLIFQLWLGMNLERRFGWLCIGMIYLVSGIGGYLISGIFDPETQSVGASGALMGLLGVKYVDLFLSWSHQYQSPCKTLFSLILDTALILFIGTTPYVDNFSHVGGLAIGIIAALIIIPYIKYKRHDLVLGSRSRWRCGHVFCFVFFFLPLLSLLFLFGFIIFYQTQNTEFCSWCHYVNCVPYVEGFCEEGFNTLVKATEHW